MKVLPHNHSQYSQFDGLSSIENMVSKAKELNWNGMALTDHGTTSGLLKFYKECKKQGIKPVLGVEFYLVPELTIKERDPMYHLVVMAKNNQGYFNLLKLTTEAHQNFYYKPRIDLDLLKKYQEGLIVTSACMAGPLRSEQAYEYALQLKNIFKENFLIEIQPNSLTEQKAYNLKVVNIAKQLNIPIVIGNDSHYVSIEDAQTHRKWKNIADDSEYYNTDDYYIMSEAEFKERLNYLSTDIVDEAIANCVWLYNECNVEIEFGGHNYPIFPVNDPLTHLKNLCQEGWEKRNIPNTNEYQERLIHELDIIDKAGYSNYFCIIYDIVNWCRENKIRVGVGRGSVVASLVSYLLGITNLDPIRYGLIFERFAHLERITAPDIDLDFPESKRQEVIKYIKQKYGEDKVFQVRTCNYMAEKGAIQRAGQALKREPKEIDRISKNFTTLQEIQDTELRELACKFVSVLQNYGCHASAIIVFPNDPAYWCAIEKQGDNYVAAYEFHNHEQADLESLGILKLDILGLKTLDVIQNTIDMINDKSLDIDNLPDIDQKTFHLINSGKTAGIFQLESKGMTNVATSIHVNHIMDFSDLVALYRPGPKDSGMLDEYIARRQGIKKIEYLHPDLEPILKNTSGIIIYQEQILQIARALCGYTLGQADMLRRGIGRKEEETVNKFADEFISKGIVNGIPEKIIQEIWNQIKTFASYGFNMGHSAAYGYTAYQTAYLKAHYPVQFMTALLNSEVGNQDKITEYIDECRNLGITILPPSIEYSSQQWTCNKNNIRVGFCAIKGVGNCLIPNFKDNFIEFMYQHGNINKKSLEAIVKAGCFSGNRNLMLAQIEWFKDKRKSKCKLEEVKPLTPVLEATMEREVLGFTFNEILDCYDLGLTKQPGIIGGELIHIKPWQTKKGDPMAFIKLRDYNGFHDLVIFSNKYQDFEEGQVYLFQISNRNIINGFTKAKPIKNQANA